MRSDSWKLLDKQNRSKPTHAKELAVRNHCNVVLSVVSSRIRHRVLLGLRQVSMLEDESGRRWRVVVAHEKGKPPYSEAKQLSGAS